MKSEDAHSIAAVSNLALQDEVTQFKDTSLLRGVPSSIVLGSFGEQLAPPEAEAGKHWTHTIKDPEALYCLSKEVTKLHRFISHSWRDHRWLKFFSMLWVVQWNIATAAGNIAALAWAVATGFGLTPTATMKYDNGIVNVYGLSSTVYTVVFVLTLLCAHPITTAVWKENYFLDKLCIHQTDPERKAAGIASLGGYLRVSDRLLVLWSPDYFNRLWCNYELACYIGVAGFDRIDFLPLAVPVFAFLFFISLSCGMIVFWCVIRFNLLIVDFGIVMLAVHCVPFTLIGIYQSRALRERLELREQLKTFRLGNSRCYCCDVSHTLPDGSKLPCDREFVESGIRKWFKEVSKNDPEVELDGITAFENNIRNLLGSRIRQLLGPTFIPMPAKGMMTMSLLLIWLGVDVALLSPDLRIRVANAVEFATAPLIIQLIGILHNCVLTLANHQGETLLKYAPKAMDLLFGVLYFVLFSVTWISWDTLVQDAMTPPLAIVAIIAIILALVLGVRRVGG